MTKHFEAGLWGSKANKFSGLTRIYPVLVVHDRAIDDPFALHYLCMCFQREFGINNASVIAEFRYRTVIVKNVIIVSIDDLEALEAAIGELSFLEILSDFSNEYPDRLATFHNYLTGSRYNLRPNTRLNLIAAKIVDGARAIFQDS